MGEPPKGREWGWTEANWQACQFVHDFIGEKVRPIIDQHTNVLPATRICNALLVRVHGWLRSLVRLDYPGHFQAILAGSRALFEQAIEFTLLSLEEQRSFAKLMAWQESAKLEYAKRLAAHKPGTHPDAAAFVRDHTQRILELRKETWKHENHPERWTGRKLPQDAERADALRLTGFVDYYAEQYRQVCWHVHGSGVIGLLELPSKDFPLLAGRGFHDSAVFGIAAARCSLELMNQFSAEHEQAFRDLELAIVDAKREIMARYPQ